MSNETTIFRLLKVPKYAKRTVASMCERKSEALAQEVGRLKEDWMEQEREIEWWKRELRRAEEELRDIKERESAAARNGGSYRLSREEEEDFETLWACYGRR